MKKKYLGANQCKFISNKLSKDIMFKSKLRNAFLKDKTNEAKTKYRKQTQTQRFKEVSYHTFGKLKILHCMFLYYCKHVFFVYDILSTLNKEKINK